MNQSCLGCKYLYGRGDGYSNWTWLDTDVHCALNRNPKLPATMPSDWTFSHWEGTEPLPDFDNWPATATSRCDQFEEGKFMTLDIEEEDGPATFSDDPAQVATICLHADRPPFGSRPEQGFKGDPWDYVPADKPEAAALVAHANAVRQLMH